MKKIAFLAFALASGTASFGGTFLLDGTSIGDTSYDVNKVWQNDDLLCWAAAGSNTIKYWQNSYVAQGFELPDGVPAGGYSSPYNSDIFKTFYDNWTNAGGFSANAMQWWFSGEIPIYDPLSSELKPGASAGGYWNEVFDFQEMGDVFTTFDFSEAYTAKTDLKDTLDDLILADTPMTASIYSQREMGHAITLWGYEYDDTLNEITGLWITDSDDDYLGNLLVNVVWSDAESCWYLQDYYGMDDWFLGSITALDIGFAVPEPSAYAAVFGVLAAGLALLRRRR